MATSTQPIDGNKLGIPVIGYGTGTEWYTGDQNGPINHELVASIKLALSLGFTHLDAAEMYGTDKEIGVAINESGIPREKLFVTTKVYSGIQDPALSLNNSLARLKLDYVDLYLIHGPFFSGITIKEAWVKMEEVHKSGKAKAIGVSNFRPQDLDEILSIASVKPAVNQIEYNPYLQQPDIVAACHKHGIIVEAYGPLTPLFRKSGGPIDAVLHEIASAHKKTPSQILLRWSTQKGNVVVTTSRNEGRLKDILDIFSFSLTNEEIKKIDEEGSKLQHRAFWTENF